jgi:hypothetical protein
MQYSEQVFYLSSNRLPLRELKFAVQYLVVHWRGNADCRRQDP